jgi:transcription elongation factor Elf1
MKKTGDTKMAWVRIEFEYTCPICGDVQFDTISAYINDLGRDISKNVAKGYCTACNACMEYSDMLDISKITIPVRDNFGASIF